jgi:hypothetical protein
MDNPEGYARGSSAYQASYDDGTPLHSHSPP